MSSVMLKRGFLLILKNLPFSVQSVLSMSAHICKVCKRPSGEVSDFILCTGDCGQYLHYYCADIAEDHYRSLSNEMEWKCNDCRVQRGVNSPEPEDLHLENDSGNSLSPDSGSVDGLDSRSNVFNIINELEILRQELTQTVTSLEQLRTEYNDTVLKVAEFERQMRAQTENLVKVSEDVRDISITVYTLGQNVGNNKVEIHGFRLGIIVTVDFKSFDVEIKRKIVEVGKCFGVRFSVEDIYKVDILKTEKIIHRPILLVHFFSREVRNMFLASRWKRVINADLPGCSDARRIYINENFCDYF